MSGSRTGSADSSVYATCVVFCSLMCIAFFKILDSTMGMRSTREAEIAGLDMPEMGALAYPDFLEAQGQVFYPVDTIALDADDVVPSAAGVREEVGR